MSEAKSTFRRVSRPPDPGAQKTAPPAKPPKPTAGQQPAKQHTLPADRPTADQLRTELARVKGRHRLGRVLRSTVYSWVVVAAVAELGAVLVLPVFRIYGSSMDPTLTEGDIVVAVKGGDLHQGDLVVFYKAHFGLTDRYIDKFHRYGKQLFFGCKNEKEH